MKSLPYIFVSILSLGLVAEEISLPINENNFICKMHRQDYYDHYDGQWTHAVYFSSAQYEMTEGGKLKLLEHFLGSDENEQTAREYCNVIENILTESRQNNGYLTISSETRTGSRCYTVNDGSVWAPRPIGSVTYFITTTWLTFPYDIIFDHSTVVEQRSADPCP